VLKSCFYFNIIDHVCSNTSVFNLRSVLGKEKLNGTNFIDWYRNLRIVLRQEKEEYVLKQPKPDELPNGATAAARRVYEKHYNESLDVSCLMLATVSPYLQKKYEHADAHSMIEGLRGMFATKLGLRGTTFQGPCLRAS
jgi:hypothetical protein